MKGTIFVELIKMAEDAFGEDAVDTILDDADLENGGAFTSVGNYPCSELVKIVLAFSQHSGLQPDVLQKMFGHWMLKHFAEHYPHFFGDKKNAFSLLEAIENEIHVEVRKLYPESELPTFHTERPNPGKLLMTYKSPRPLASFCEGMIEASLVYFNETGDILSEVNAANSNITHFKVTLQS